MAAPKRKQTKAQAQDDLDSCNSAFVTVCAILITSPVCSVYLTVSLAAWPANPGHT